MSDSSGKKWAIILGGSRGLGLATAKKLAKHDYAICLVHRDRRSEMEAIEEQFSEIKKDAADFYSFNADAVNQEKRAEIVSQLRNSFQENDTVKLLIHSIAKGSLKPMGAARGESLSTEDFEITFRAMALSLYDWVQSLILAELTDPDMRIISFTSEGNARAMPGYAAVSVAKVALEAITRSMAVEFAPLGIKANCIQAGVTETSSFAMIPNSERIKKNAIKRNPSGRITSPEDVANTVFMLSLDEAKWITGSIIKADGGESLR
ncbi:MAG: SDR family oxidoreductase [Muriicola sp.]|nr:SDR family oxidoreductase [Muriicola sp.]NNC63050.1 SDR family oxidoreductase [Eudoraea sp.]NNK34881.1 SDR family oxidoreductase [Eudoraea sp.]